MIDFVSTRQTTDPQTAACARLLAAVISRAIQDACTPILDDEKIRQQNIDCHALGSIVFLFASDSPFPLFASLIGGSAETIRAALLNKSYNIAPLNQHSAFGDKQRRILNRRKLWWEE